MSKLLSPERIADYREYLATTPPLDADVYAAVSELLGHIDAVEAKLAKAELTTELKEKELRYWMDAAETAEARVRDLETRNARLLGRAAEKHAPDCEDRCHGTYVCKKCKSVCGWCYGAGDELFELCDDCAAATWAGGATTEK